MIIQKNGLGNKARLFVYLPAEAIKALKLSHGQELIYSMEQHQPKIIRLAKEIELASSRKQ